MNKEEEKWFIFLVIYTIALGVFFILGMLGGVYLLERWLPR